MNKSIIEHIHDMRVYIRDPRMDGFSQWGAKQKLYKILWETQKQLEDAPLFYEEDLWVKENGWKGK